MKYEIRASGGTVHRTWTPQQAAPEKSPPPPPSGLLCTGGAKGVTSQVGYFERD